jgi:hypothetical protein
MVHHYPRTFWSLLIVSYGLIIGACYAWVEQHNWPYAASTLGTILLITFALISISYVGAEAVVNARAIEGLLEREGRGYTRHDRNVQGAAPSLYVPPVAPIVVKTEPDPTERNVLIAQNTGELQKNNALLHESNQQETDRAHHQEADRRADNPS